RTGDLPRKECNRCRKSNGSAPRLKLARFRVTNYRSIRDSGWVEVEAITAFVGQNEAGKSNLFEALYRLNPFAPDEAYDIDEDWPVDDWGNKDPTACVCEA